jgi:hypothetical protein
MALSGLANGTTYYWRVQAKSGDQVSGWSDTSSFTTLPATPPVPTLLSPANNSTNISLDPTLSWTTVSGALTYDVQVSTSSSFASIFVEDSALAVGSQALSGLANAVTYYWRVNAINAGGPSAWTAAWDFTTLSASPPPVPTLTAPANAATSVSINPTLTWATVGTASSYEVQVSTSSTFAGLVAEDSTLTVGSKAITGLLHTMTYFWHVQAKNAYGLSGWSYTWNFMTIPSSVLPQRNLITINDISTAGSTIQYSIPSAANVSMKLYDIRGRIVQTLLSGMQEAGLHSIAIPAMLPQGRYVLSYKAGDYRIDKSVLIIK